MMMIKSYSQGTDTALSERKKKKLQKRIERLLVSSRHERKNHKLYLELGDSYASLEDIEEAEKHYTAAIDILRQDSVDEKARKQIIVLYGKILNLEPTNYDAYTQLGQEYMAAGQKEKASRFLLSSGKRAFENGDYELALQCYEQVIDLGKSNPYIIERCTEIFLKLGRKEDAIENYVKIGNMYAREEKAVEALEYYKKASALDSESPDLTLKVARMYYTLEWTENAAAEMVKIAEYYEQQQNFTEALKFFQRSLSLDRENDRALAGKLRISASQNIKIPGKPANDEKEESQENILEELDLVEDALKTQSFAETEEEKHETAKEAELVSAAEILAIDESRAADSEERESSEKRGSNVIDISDMFSNDAGSTKSQKADREESEALEGQAAGQAEVDDLFQFDLRNPSQPKSAVDGPQNGKKEDAVAWQDRLLDLNLEEDFVLMTGLEEQNGEDAPTQVPPFSNDTQQTSKEENGASSPEVPIFDELSPKSGDEGDAEKSRKLESPPSAEDGKTDAGLFEGLDLSSTATDDDKAEDVFASADLTAGPVTGAADENPFEDMRFEALPEEKPAEKTDAAPNVLHMTEGNEGQQEGQESGDVSEAGHAAEMTNIEDDAEKLIAETPMTEAKEPQLSTPANEPAPENTPKEALVESTATEVEMPPTYTPIKEPEKIHRVPFRGTVPELKKKLGDLEKQLESTEEEKYFLQEQFTAQISKLKLRGTHIKREYERARKDKDDLQHRLEEVTSIYESSRQKANENDEARYEAIVNKIQRKKQALQQHVNKLLEQREQNGRFLTEELKSLSSTKLRLQNNLEYIQQVKTRVEQKIHSDLRRAQEEIQQLSSRSLKLEGELGAKQKSEQHLHVQFKNVQKEKEMLQDQFTETISALTEENEKIGGEFKELSKEKLETEHLLKKKFKALHLSYQRLRSEFKTSVQSKEVELSRTAQRLSQFADEYVKLETTLKDIRKERDKLEKMLAQETATRERLEENLTDIESQVDSLEVQGSELLEQLDQELDRQLKVKQSTSDEFQMSLGELEKLLALQEREIQNLEVL